MYYKTENSVVTIETYFDPRQNAKKLNALGLSAHSGVTPAYNQPAKT